MTTLKIKATSMIMLTSTKYICIYAGEIKEPVQFLKDKAPIAMKRKNLTL